MFFSFFFLARTAFPVYRLRRQIRFGKVSQKKKSRIFLAPDLPKSKKKTWVKGMFFFFFCSLVTKINSPIGKSAHTHNKTICLRNFFSLLFFAFLEQIQSFLNAIVSFSFFFLKVWQLCTGFGRLWTDLQPVLQFSCATKFYRVLLGFIGFERGLTGWTGFYWVLLGFFQVEMGSNQVFAEFGWV